MLYHTRYVMDDILYHKLTIFIFINQKINYIKTIDILKKIYYITIDVS